MNRKTSTTILGMLVLGGLISVAYASTTIITDTGITTTNLTILGTCTGCGGGEGTFTSWAKLFNGTVAGTSAGAGGTIYVNNTGTVIFEDNNGGLNLVGPSGTAIAQVTAPVGITTPTNYHTAQSTQGAYQIILDETHSKIVIYKNRALLFTIGVKMGDFTTGPSNHLSVGISPNGQYVAVQGDDTGGALDRLVIFKGS